MSDDDEHRQPSEPTENVRMLTRAKLALQTLLQSARAHKPAVEHLPSLLAEKGHSNPGHAVVGLVKYAGFTISADGKKLTPRANASEPLVLQPKAGSTTLRPAAQRPTVAAGLAAMNLEHDAAARTTGTRAAQAAAAAARPPVPRVAGARAVGPPLAVLSVHFARLTERVSLIGCSNPYRCSRAASLMVMPPRTPLYPARAAAAASASSPPLRLRLAPLLLDLR